ncbi:MAG: TrkA family potassium uptake protein [Bacteroidota bacterium]
MNDQRRFVLIGLGAYGTEIAKTLLENDADVIVMDRDPAAVKQMKVQGCRYAVHIDNLDPSSLAKFIKPEDILILAMGDSFEAHILTIELLKGLGVKTIYARATKDIQYRVLEKMGITEILFPERHEGRRFALKLLNRNFHFIDEFASDIFLIEIPVKGELAGKTILEHEIRAKHNVNIIGLKIQTFDPEGKEIINTDYVGFENTTLTTNHTLLVLGKDDDLAELVRNSR